MIAVVCLMMVCAVAYGQESSVESDQAVVSPSTSCTNGNLTRVVEITYGGEQGRAPCEVHYKKVTEDPSYDQVLWSAQHKDGYCETKKQQFVEKLVGWGWDCR